MWLCLCLGRLLLFASSSWACNILLCKTETAMTHCNTHLSSSLRSQLHSITEVISPSVSHNSVQTVTYAGRAPSFLPSLLCCRTYGSRTPLSWYTSFPALTLLPSLSKKRPPLMICGAPSSTRPKDDSGVRYSMLPPLPCACTHACISGQPTANLGDATDHLYPVDLLV